MKYYAVFEIPDEIVKDPDALKCGAVIYESERFDEKEVISFEKTKLQRMSENPAKEVKAPVGTVKSVTIVKDDGTKQRIPLDKVIIERTYD